MNIGIYLSLLVCLFASNLYILHLLRRNHKLSGVIVECEQRIKCLIHSKPPVVCPFPGIIPLTTNAALNKLAAKPPAKGYRKSSPFAPQFKINLPNGRA